MTTPAAVRNLRILTDLAPGQPRDAAGRNAGVRFVTSEYAILDDGRKLLIVADKGWTVFPGNLSANEYLNSVSLLDINQGSYNALLADNAEASGEWQDWQTFAARLRAHGIVVSAQELRSLPYTFEVSNRIRVALQDCNGHDR